MAATWQLFLFVYYLVVQLMVGRSHTILNAPAVHLSNRGNEIAQAKHLFGLTERFNENQFFNDMADCDIGPRPVRCYRTVHAKYREGSRLWSRPIQTFLPSPRPAADCTYTFGNTTLRRYSALTTVLSVGMVQGNCRVGGSIVGGATIEAFALNEDSVAHCSTTDQFDNTYQINCAMTPTSPSLKRHNRLYCANLTVVLMYEHFDGFSEALEEQGVQLPALRRLLLDNALYCTPGAAPVLGTPIHADRSNINRVGDISLDILPTTVSWYTGVWARTAPTPRTPLQALIDRQQLAALPSNTTAATNLGYHYAPHATSALYVYLSYHGTRTNYSAFLPQQTGTISQLAVQDPRLTADLYQFQPVVKSGRVLNRIQSNLQPSSGSTPSAHQTRQHCLRQGFEQTVCDFWPSYTADPPLLPGLAIDERQHLKNFTRTLHAERGVRWLGRKRAKPTMHYHFIGASHMRYIFDSISQYYFGEGSLEGVDRKHADLRLSNLNLAVFVYMHTQTTYLTELCANLSRAATIRDTYSYAGRTQHTLILQTGAWDLAYMPLRRALRGAVSQRLLSVLGGILNGSLLCGDLRHLVYLTPVPYPLCFNDDIKPCEGGRGYRTNAANSALGQHIAAQLVRMASSASTGASRTSGTDRRAKRSSGQGQRQLHLSVVDAFGIVAPRLVFNEDSEVACTCHYSCRATAERNVALGTANSTTVLVHTPGGAALVRSVLNALTLF